MNPRMKSLLWKEWHEQRWRAAFNTVILTAFTAIGLKARLIPDIAVLYAVVALGTFLGPLLVAMGIVAPERADGSLANLLALPERPWRILASKLLVGAGAILVPIAAAALVAVTMAGGREMSSFTIVFIYLATGWTALSFMTWTLAFGIGVRTEARVGLTGLCMIGFWAVWAFAPRFLDVLKLDALKLDEMLWRIHPFYILACLESRYSKPWDFFILQLTVITFLVIWTGHRFSRLARRAS